MISIFPDSTTIVDFMLDRFTGIIDKLQVYPENMLLNLHKMNGLTFSQGLLLKLARKGVRREEAYEMVQRNAMRVWKEGVDFRSLILGDEAIMNILTKDEVEGCFDLNQYLRHIDEIFERVFG